MVSCHSIFSVICQHQGSPQFIFNFFSKTFSKVRFCETRSTFPPQINKVTLPNMKPCSSKYQKPTPAVLWDLSVHLLESTPHFETAGPQPLPGLPCRGGRHPPSPLAKGQVPGDVFGALETMGLPQQMKPPQESFWVQVNPLALPMTGLSSTECHFLARKCFVKFQSIHEEVICVQ